MHKHLHSLGVIAAITASALVVAPAGAQEKPKPRIEAPAPPVIIPAPPRSGPPPAAVRPMTITNPSWATRPLPEYPELAILNGVTEGRATLQCVVNPDGKLSSCEIVEETPAGAGFGQATLAAAQVARVSPRTVDGAAVGARVRFSVRFVMPEAAPITPPPPVLIPVRPARPRDRIEYSPTIVPVPPAPPITPEWTTPPVVEFPERASSRGIETGRVTIQCQVGADGLPLACTVVREDPAGAGFGAAALRAMPGARVSPTIPVGAYIRFVINFSTPAEPASDSDASGG